MWRVVDYVVNGEGGVVYRRRYEWDEFAAADDGACALAVSGWLRAAVGSLRAGYCD